MKKLLLCLVILSSIAPLAFAASDCEHTCCRQWNASWDDDFDNCRHPKAGYDNCVAECDARVWAARPQGPGPASPENTYTCKMGFILPFILAAALFYRKSLI